MYFVIGVVFVLLGIIIGLFAFFLLIKEDLVKINKMLAEKSEINAMVYKWISNNDRGCSISKYLREHGLNRIGIYGLGDLGEILFDELKRDRISIECVIDRNADCLCTDVLTCKPDDIIPKVDVILVTPIQHFDNIRDELKNKVDCPIVSIADVIFSI